MMPVSNGCHQYGGGIAGDRAGCDPVENHSIDDLQWKILDSHFVSNETATISSWLLASTLLGLADERTSWVPSTSGFVPRTID
jgi:hypothetical protein